MRRRWAFGWTTAGILGVWSLHNVVLHPIEAARFPPEQLEPALLGLRALVWLGPALLYLRRYEPRPLREVFALLPSSPRGVWVGLAPGLGLLALAALLIGPPAALPAGPGAVAALLVGVLLEELLLRGFVFGQLALGWSGGRVVLATALLFAGAHLPGWWGEGMPMEAIIPSFVVLLLFGLAHGFARWKSGWVGASVLLHLLQNLLAG